MDNCGTRKAKLMVIGYQLHTCSTTNYHITEVSNTALCQGKSVEWYVFDVSQLRTIINVYRAMMMTYTDCRHKNFLQV